MENSLIQTFEGQIRLGTWELSKRIEAQHRFVKSSIERKMDAFLNIGSLPYIKIKPEKPGRPIKEYLLNRYQCGWTIFLCSINGYRKAIQVEVRSQSCKTDTEYFKFLDENL